MLREDGKVIWNLRRPWSDGTRSFVFDPLTLIGRLVLLHTCTTRGNSSCGISGSRIGWPCPELPAWNAYLPVRYWFNG
jgi:hypothetical protein